VHAGFGNHDYSARGMTRENTHELFRRKFGLKPYYSVEHRGWKFIHLNNFLGDTGPGATKNSARIPDRWAKSN
jgi:hypothetical protein